MGEVSQLLHNFGLRPLPSEMCDVLCKSWISARCFFLSLHKKTFWFSLKYHFKTMEPSHLNMNTLNMKSSNLNWDCVNLAECAKNWFNLNKWTEVSKGTGNFSDVEYRNLWNLNCQELSVLYFNTVTQDWILTVCIFFSLHHPCTCNISVRASCGYIYYAFPEDGRVLDCMTCQPSYSVILPVPVNQIKDLVI